MILSFRPVEGAKRCRTDLTARRRDELCTTKCRMRSRTRFLEPSDGPPSSPCNECINTPRRRRNCLFIKYVLARLLWTGPVGGARFCSTWTSNPVQTDDIQRDAVQISAQERGNQFGVLAGVTKWISFFGGSVY